MFHPWSLVGSLLFFCFCVMFSRSSFVHLLLAFMLYLLNWFTAYDQFLGIFTLFWLFFFLFSFFFRLRSMSCVQSSRYPFLIAYLVFSNVYSLIMKTLPIRIFVVRILCTFIFSSDSNLSRWNCIVYQLKQGACRNVAHSSFIIVYKSPNMDILKYKIDYPVVYLNTENVVQ